MEKYKVYLENKDFRAVDSDIVLKGSRKKRIVVDNEHNTAFLKYQNYIVNESCSEKLAYEIANLLGYNCARIELAMDAENKLCVLNYLFLNEDDEHTDAIAYINKDGAERQDYYTISNIKLMLDSLDKTLFDGFIKMMIFDALVGEQDRHEENWGIINNKNQYSFSPMYDNGCCLLREFKNEELAKEYYSGKKDFDAYIRRSQTYFYKEGSNKRYKHFELIKYLYDFYPEKVEKEIKQLDKLTDSKIEELVNKIPDKLMGNDNKKFIIKYLIVRRDILKSIIA